MSDVKLTAAQEVVLAADDLASTGRTRFTEWDLTVAAWKRSPSRFGLRGYEDQFPDHKRVMMEVMGQAKSDNPVRRRFLAKVATNTYAITDLGRAEAGRIRAERGGAQDDEPRSPGRIFTAVEPHVDHPSFRAWLRDPAEPRTWLGASAFLRLRRNTANDLNDAIREIRTAADSAVAWCTETGTDAITRGSRGGSRAIPRTELERLRQFIDMLEERFARQMNAIRGKA